MNVRTVFAVAIAALLSTALYAAPKKKIRIAPGATCYVWNQNTINKPQTIPVGGFVDEGIKFAPRNIHQCQELRNITSKSFIMWEGYLRVPKAGAYRFTMTLNDGYNQTRETNLKIFLNNTLLMHKSRSDQMTLSAQATLKKGFVKLRVYMNPTGYGFGAGITLKFAPAMGMKMTEITPGGLYHPLSAEE